MELTPEDHQRIYLEEKARIEARQELQRERKMGIGGILLWTVFGILGVVLVMGIIAAISDEVPTVQPHASPTLSRNAPRTGNVAHDQLLNLDPAARASFLATIVLSSGDRCVGTDAFFMGLHPQDQEAYWSVRCSNGKSYEVAIQADARGSTRVVDCDLMRVVAKISCFKKLDSQ